ncbi:hypothetical protein ACFGZ5_11370 [Pasteurella multocida]|uniref:hypothetical protein n=1 Tax=Pasteurella multocida TaxID=747 RepID=UPI002FE3CDC1
MVKIPTKLKEDKAVIDFIKSARDKDTVKIEEKSKTNKKQVYQYERGSRCTINLTNIQAKFFEEAMTISNHKKYNAFIDTIITYAEKTSFKGEDYLEYLPIAYHKGTPDKKIHYYKTKPSKNYLKTITDEWRYNWYNVGIKGAIIFMTIHYIINFLGKKIKINEERECTII